LPATTPRARTATTRATLCTTDGHDVYDDAEDTYAPTTEDFGSGSGSVGRCADGTLSDSIGRPGACSHHGGVG